MRTTLSLDDDVLEELKSYAEARALSLGKAASELIRKGVSAPLQTRMMNGLHVLDLPADAPPITLKTIKRFQDDEL